MLNSSLDPVQIGPMDASLRRRGGLLVPGCIAALLALGVGGFALDRALIAPSDPGALRGEWRSVPLPGAKIAHGSVIDFEPGSMIVDGKASDAVYDLSKADSVAVIRGGVEMRYVLGSGAVATAPDGSVLLKIRR